MESKKAEPAKPETQRLQKSPGQVQPKLAFGKAKQKSPVSQSEKQINCDMSAEKLKPQKRTFNVVSSARDNKI